MCARYIRFLIIGYHSNIYVSDYIGRKRAGKKVIFVSRKVDISSANFSPNLSPIIESNFVLYNR